MSTSTRELSASRPAQAVLRQSRDKAGNEACWRIKPKVKRAVTIRWGAP